MALSFNGSNAIVNLGGTLNEGFAVPMAFCAWVRPANVGTEGEPVGRGHATAGWGVTVNANVGFVFSNIIWVQSSTLPAMSNGNWYFIAVVRTTGNLRFIQVTTGGTLTAQNVANSTTPFEGSGVSSVLGARGSSLTSPFNGVMAHPAYWDGAAPTDTDLLRFSKWPGLQNGLSVRPNYYWPLFIDGSDHSTNPQNGSLSGGIAKSALMPPTRRTPV